MRFGCIVIIEKAAIKNEPEPVDRKVDPLTEDLFEFIHLGCLFNPEVDLVDVLRFVLY